jgi:hypothetical protein
MTDKNSADAQVSARAVIDKLRLYWRFDDYQQPFSSWHEREDFVSKVLPPMLNALVATARREERERTKEDAAKILEAGVDEDHFDPALDDYEKHYAAAIRSLPESEAR